MSFAIVGSAQLTHELLHINLIITIFCLLYRCLNTRVALFFTEILNQCFYFVSVYVV